jgi:hypothetical protein
MRILTLTKRLAFLSLFMCYATTVNAKIQGGGIQFMKPKAIAINRQDVTLSLDKINSNYVFVNNSALELIETLVFPAPNNLEKKKNIEEQPFNNLEIIANGIKIEYKTLEHPLNIQGKSYTNVYYYWQQQFLPAKEVHISQVYKPNVRIYRNNVHFASKTNYSHPWLNKLRHKKSTQSTTVVNEEDDLKNLKSSIANAFPYIKNFCPKNEDYVSLLHSFNNTNQKILVSREVQYNLVYNDNWSGPIEHFTIQIEHPDNMLVLSCWPHKFARTSPTTLLFSADNYTPMQDLAILFVQKT